jgi:hypothetical protein
MLHNMHIASVCFKCLMCFIRMFQVFDVFHLDVAKVDLDVAYVFAMHFKCFQVFQTYVASVSAISNMQVFSYGCCKSRSGCCTCCDGTHLLQTPAVATGAPHGSQCGGLGPEEASASGAGHWVARGFPMCGHNIHQAKNIERDGRGKKRARQRLDASTLDKRLGASKSDCQYNCTSISEKHNYSIIRNEFLCF